MGLRRGSAAGDFSHRYRKLQDCHPEPDFGRFRLAQYALGCHRDDFSPEGSRRNREPGDARALRSKKIRRAICGISTTVVAARDHFLIKTFDGPNGHGKTLAVARAAAEILPGKSTAVPLALDGVVASVELELENPSPQATPTAIPVIVAAKDASGATIIGADDYDKPITLVDEDKSGATELSTNQAVSPSTAVVFEYDGSPKLTKAIISAQVSGVPPAAIIPAELVPVPDGSTPAPDASPTPTSSPGPTSSPKADPSSSAGPTPVPTRHANR